MAARLSKYRGRSARVTRSATEDCYWDTSIDQMYRTSDGSVLSAIEMYSRGMSTASRLNKEAAGMRFFRRSHHGHIIAKDARGWAFCKDCGLIFNDGVKGEDRAEVEEITVGYTPSLKEAKAPPPRRYRKPKRAAR